MKELFAFARWVNKQTIEGRIPKFICDEFTQFLFPMYVSTTDADIITFWNQAITTIEEEFTQNQSLYNHSIVAWAKYIRRMSDAHVFQIMANLSKLPTAAQIVLHEMFIIGLSVRDVDTDPYTTEAQSAKLKKKTKKADSKSAIQMIVTKAQQKRIPVKKFKNPQITVCDEEGNEITNAHQTMKVPQALKFTEDTPIRVIMDHIASQAHPTDSKLREYSFDLYFREFLTYDTDLKMLAPFAEGYVPKKDAIKYGAARAHYQEVLGRIAADLLDDAPIFQMDTYAAETRYCRAFREILDPEHPDKKVAQKSAKLLAYAGNKSFCRLVSVCPAVASALFKSLAFDDYNVKPGTLIRSKHMKFRRMPTPQLKFGTVPITTPQSGVAYTVVLRDTNSRQSLKMLNALYPETSATDSRHMTCHPADLVFTYLNAPSEPYHQRPLTQALRKRNVQSFLDRVPIGTNQTLFITAFLLSLGHEETDIVQEVIMEGNLLSVHPIAQHTVLKEFSTCVRRSTILPDGKQLTPTQVSALAYWELAFGRSANISDWPQEKKNRCSGTRHIIIPEVVDPEATLPLPWRTEPMPLSSRMKCNSEFYDMLHLELYDIAKILVSKRSVRDSLETFAQRRHEWCANGSAGDASVTISVNTPGLDAKVKRRMERVGITEERIKIGKRAKMETMTSKEIAALLTDKKPEEYAVASEKMENGKSRAIYGVEINHYIISSYATDHMEERMHMLPGCEKGLSGMFSYGTEVQRAEITSNKDLECTMLDYADFNVQHTPQAQALMFEAFAQVGELRGNHKDWIKANRWLAAAKYNQIVRFPGESTTHKVKQGMYSGTKTTDLMNTVMNLAYYNVAKKLVKKNYDLEPVDEHHVHQGDDVWVSNRSRMWAAALYYTLNGMGFEFQPKKQMFGPNRGEFLRVLYEGGNAYGYCARAIINYVQRPLQNMISSDPADWAQSLTASHAVLGRRGMGLDMLHVMYKNDVLYWTKVKSHPTDCSPIAIPKQILNAPIKQRGLGAVIPRVVTVLEGHLSAYPEKVAPELHMDDYLPHNMSSDWISALSQRIGASRSIKSKALLATLVTANYTDVARIVDPHGSSRSLKEKWSHYLKYSWGGPSKAQLTYYPAHQYTPSAILASRGMVDLVQSQPDSYYYPNWVKQTLHPTPIRTPRDFHACISLINRMITSSIFKSLPTTATALDLTNAEALLWIMSNNKLDTEAAQSLQELVRTLIAHNMMDVIYDLLKDSYGWFAAYAYNQNPNHILDAVAQSKQGSLANLEFLNHYSSDYYETCSARALTKFTIYWRSIVKTLPRICY